jgi:hypothetical protein
MHKVKRIAAFVCIRPVGAAVIDFETQVWAEWVVPGGREIDAEDFGGRVGVCHISVIFIFFNEFSFFGPQELLFWGFVRRPQSNTSPNIQNITRTCKRSEIELVIQEKAEKPVASLLISMNLAQKKKTSN